MPVRNPGTPDRGREESDANHDHVETTRGNLVPLEIELDYTHANQGGW
jgi:hypothetical protein